MVPGSARHGDQPKRSAPGAQRTGATTALTQAALARAPTSIEEGKRQTKLTTVTLGLRARVEAADRTRSATLSEDACRSSPLPHVYRGS